MTNRKLFYPILLLLLSTSLMSCHEKVANSNLDTSLDSFAVLCNPQYAVKSRHIRSQLDLMVRNDNDGMTPDYRARNYYRRKGDFLWIQRTGISHKADTLLNYLKTVEEMGFSTKSFRLPQIERDLQAARSLQFDSSFFCINKVYGRLEYNLTKAYLRYVVGQRFGYMNPTYIFNRLDTIEDVSHDSIPRPVRYRGLFDIDMEHATDDFYQMALHKIGTDSLPVFLKEIQPRNNLYMSLKQRLQQPNLCKELRVKIICNMERARWRLKDEPQKHSKYVIVNLPSFHLTAIDHQDTLTMRIGCGTFKTKTPLLTSEIMRMDLNPKWHIPRSIILKDIIHHVGDRAYFDQRNFYVFDRKKKEEVDLSNVTHNMLRDPNFAVVQRGGKGNSLGRIIFRFDNNFSVYLHDTSSRDFFSRADRGVSHGCVRVEKPLDLAQFLLHEKDGRLMKKLEYSMTADSLADKSKVVGSLRVEPEVPLFITYYTLYPQPGGRWEEYCDIYGYDREIFNFLNNYIDRH